jgi:hypothetical protein
MLYSGTGYMLASGLEVETFSMSACVQLSALDKFAGMHKLFADMDAC